MPGAIDMTAKDGTEAGQSTSEAAVPMIDRLPNSTSTKSVFNLPDCKRNCKRTMETINRIQQKMLLFIRWNKQNNLMDTTKEELKEQLKLTDRQTYYNIKELLRKELVVKEAPNVYLLALAEKGKAYTASIMDLQNDRSYVSQFRFLDRAHKITIVAKLASRPKGVVPPGFTASGGSKKLHWKFPALTRVDKVKGVTVLINDSSVSFGFSSIYGFSAHDVVHSALNRCIGLADELGMVGFKVLLPSLVIVQQHHALSDKDFAKYTAKFGVHWVSDRLVFDKSVSPNEFELVDSGSAPGDFVNLVEVFEAIVRGEVTKEQLVELAKMLPELKRLLGLKGRSEDES